MYVVAIEMQYNLPCTGLIDRVVHATYLGACIDRSILLRRRDLTTYRRFKGQGDRPLGILGCRVSLGGILLWRSHTSPKPLRLRCGGSAADNKHYCPKPLTIQISHLIPAESIPGPNTERSHSRDQEPPFKTSWSLPASACCTGAVLCLYVASCTPWNTVLNSPRTDFPRPTTRLQHVRMSFYTSSTTTKAMYDGLLKLDCTIALSSLYHHIPARGSHPHCMQRPQLPSSEGASRSNFIVAYARYGSPTSSAEHQLLRGECLHPSQLLAW